MKLHALAGIFSLMVMLPLFIFVFIFCVSSLRIFYAIFRFLISLILIARLNYWTFVIVAWLFRANLHEERMSLLHFNLDSFLVRAREKNDEKKLDKCANIIEKSWKSKGRDDERFASHISRDSRRPRIAREINSLARHPVDVLIQFLLSGFFIHRPFCNVNSQCAWSINHESAFADEIEAVRLLRASFAPLLSRSRENRLVAPIWRCRVMKSLCFSKTRPSTEWRGISSSEWDGNWKFEFQPTACKHYRCVGFGGELAVVKGNENWI